MKPLTCFGNILYQSLDGQSAFIRITDHGSHFVNHDMQALMLEHGVSHFTGPVSHPSSTGLLERTVQEMLAQISKKCIERGTTNSWSLSVRDNALNMNTKSTKIHGYSPAQIMLGFEPKHFHFDIEPRLLPDPEQAEQPLPEHQYQLALRCPAQREQIAI